MKYYYFTYNGLRRFRITTQAMEKCLDDLQKFGYTGAAYVLRELKNDARLRAAARAVAKKHGAPYTEPMQRRIYDTEVTPLDIACRATHNTMNVLISPDGLLCSGMYLIWEAPGPDTKRADTLADNDPHRRRRLRAMALKQVPAAAPDHPPAPIA